MKHQNNSHEMLNSPKMIHGNRMFTHYKIVVTTDTEYEEMRKFKRKIHRIIASCYFVDVDDGKLRFDLRSSNGNLFSLEFYFFGFFW